MNGGMGDMHSEVDRYIDGVMDEPQRRQFERALADRADLQRELRAQEALDGSLRRLFSAPCSAGSLNGAGRSVPGIAESGIDDRHSAVSSPAAGRESRSSRLRLPRLTPLRAVAAAVAIGALCWLGWIGYQSSPLARTPLERLYAQGSHADWECKDEAEFIKTFQDKLGQGLRLSHTPEQVEIRGLKYSKVISSYTVVLCARVDCRDAFVLVDVLASDKKELQLRESSGLRVFRRELGKLVLYELTPWEQPRLLDALELASVPPPEQPL
jgi:hypothetical protein